MPGAGPADAGALGERPHLLADAGQVRAVVAQREAPDRDLVLDRLAAEDDHGDVVELSRLAGELLDRSQHHLQRVAGAAAGAVPEALLHALVAVLLLGHVGRFGDAVGIDEQLAAGRHAHRRFVIGEPVEHGQRDAPGQRDPFDAVARDQGRRVVAAVGIEKTPVAHVVHAVEDRHEHVPGGGLDQGVVDDPQALAGAVLHLPGGGADDRARDRHEHRRRHALAGDVADDDADAVLVQPEEVVEVAADLLGGMHGGLDLDARRLEALAGQERALHPAGDLQIALQGHVRGLGAQRFLELRHQRRQALLLPADPAGHLPEGQSDHLQLVAAVIVAGRVHLHRGRRRLHLGKVVEDVAPLLLVQGVGKACHLALNEPLLLAPAQQRPAAVPAQCQRLHTERVHGAGDARHLVVRLLLADRNGRLRVAAGERVQHHDAVGQTGQRAAKVEGEPDQRCEHESRSRQSGDQADPPLIGVDGAHVLHRDHARNQVAELGFERKRGVREHLVARAHRLRRASGQPSRLADELPDLRIGPHQQAAPPVHDQRLRPGVLLQLGQRLQDVGRQHGHRQRRAVRVVQRNPDRQRHVALGVDRHAAAGPSPLDHARQRVVAGSRGGLERRLGGVQHLPGG